MRISNLSLIQHKLNNKNNEYGYKTTQLDSSRTKLEKILSKLFNENYNTTKA